LKLERIITIKRGGIKMNKVPKIVQIAFAEGIDGKMHLVDSKELTFDRDIHSTIPVTKRTRTDGIDERTI